MACTVQDHDPQHMETTDMTPRTNRTYTQAVNIGTLAGNTSAAAALAEAWIDHAIANPDEIPYAVYKTIVDEFITIAVLTRHIENLQAQQVAISAIAGSCSISLDPAIKALRDKRSQSLSALDMNLSLSELA